MCTIFLGLICLSNATIVPLHLNQTSHLTLFYGVAFCVNLYEGSCGNMIFTAQPGLHAL